MSLFQPPDMSAMYPQGRPNTQLQTQMPVSQPQGGGSQMPGVNPLEQPPVNTSRPILASASPSEEEDAMNALAQQQQQQNKQYTGNPTLDKYIHLFLG